MKATATLEKVIETVHAMSANYHDETLPVKDMEFDSAESMWIAGQKFEVLPSAQKLFSNRLRVPYSYLTRCPEDLQARNLNHWIAEEQKKRDTLFCRFDGDKLRAIFTDRYQAMDNLLVLSKMLEYGFQLAQYLVCFALISNPYEKPPYYLVSPFIRVGMYQHVNNMFRIFNK